MWYSFRGLIGGAILGLLIGTVYEATDNDDVQCPFLDILDQCESEKKWRRVNGVVNGVLIGAGAGFAVGIVLYYVAPPTGTIDCH
jgi:hypothetical protein